MRAWLMALGSVSGLFGAAGVALAAAGAHRSGNPNVTTAAFFLLFHAAAIVALCAVARPSRPVGILVGTTTLAIGVSLFSGELAAHALADIAAIPYAAPTGGLLMIGGWFVVAATLPAELGKV